MPYIYIYIYICMYTARIDENCGYLLIMCVLFWRKSLTKTADFGGSAILGERDWIQIRPGTEQPNHAPNTASEGVWIHTNMR